MSTKFSTYRDLVRSSLSKWHELSWLARFLQTPKPADGEGTSAHVFELIENHFVASQTDGTAASLSQALEVEAQDSRLRIVLLAHGDSWDVDRDLVDIVCSRYRIDPRFVAQHFDYPSIDREKNCPRDLRLAIDELRQRTYRDQYPWDHGGDVMSSLSMQLGSSFFFSYKKECLSLAVHQEHGKITCK